MFRVCNVVVREDEDKEKYNFEDLIRFNSKDGLDGKRVECFKTWFECSGSVVWKPTLPPPTFSKDVSSPHEKEQRTETRNPNIDHNEPSNTAQTTNENIPGISPLLKKYLTRDALNNATGVSSKNIQWCSSIANARQALKREKRKEPDLSVEERGFVEEQSMIEKLKEKASCLVGVCPNSRGKWVIYASLINNGYTLEDLWSKLSDELCQGLFQSCNITFQKDPDGILIYTDFLSCTMVPKVFSSVRDMVKKMSYVVHPNGQVLSWTPGGFVI